MNEHCEVCPVAAGKPCIAADVPDRYGHWCDLARKGREIDLKMIVGRSARPEPPPMVERVASFVGAVASHLAAGRPTVSAKVKESRLAICRTNECGHYSNDPNGPMCLACGCDARGLALKASWADQSCPLDPPRWGPIKAVADRPA